MLDQKEYYKQWCENNKEKRKKQAEKYYINNREKCLLSSKKWAENNPEKIKKFREMAAIKYSKEHNRCHASQELLASGIPYCQTCKRIDIQLRKDSNILGKQRFLCAECGTKRHKKWLCASKENRDKAYKITRSYEGRNKEKRSAWGKCQHIKLQPCVICGNSKTIRHHEDYNKPLDIIFLCRFHHAQLHKNSINLKSIG